MQTEIRKTALVTIIRHAIVALVEIPNVNLMMSKQIPSLKPDEHGSGLQSKFVKIHFLSLLLALLGVPLTDVCAQSPSSIGGRTIQLTISSGSAPFASNGVYRFLPSATDNAYAIVPIAGAVSASFGTHTYTKMDTNSAQLSFTDSVVGTLTANCTFITTNSGTYVLTGVSFPGSSQSGTFFLYSGPSPVFIGGFNIIVTVTSGAQPFATNGSYQFLPELSGNAYTIVGRSGVADSLGSCSYIRNSPMTGMISFTDSVTGSGLSSELSFDSETSGTAFLRQSTGSGYQTGTFTITTPGTVIAWGNNLNGQTTVPVTAQGGVNTIAAGFYHSLAVKNGSVLAWGTNDYGQTTVPILAQSGVIAIAAGGNIASR
ncbi:MAG: hypothetical protein ABIR24_04705 [Verrucomicrobiota bacterium]